MKVAIGVHDDNSASECIEGEISLLLDDVEKGIVSDEFCNSNIELNKSMPLQFSLGTKEQDFLFSTGSPLGLHLGQISEDGSSIVLGVFEGSQAHDLNIPTGAVIVRVNDIAVMDHSTTLQRIEEVKGNTEGNGLLVLRMRLPDADLVITSDPIGTSAQRRSEQTLDTQLVPLTGGAVDDTTTFSTSSVRELKLMIKSAGLTYLDCKERTEFLARAKEAKMKLAQKHLERDRALSSDSQRQVFSLEKEEETFEFMPGPAGVELGQASKGEPSIITSVEEGTQASSIQLPLKEEQTFEFMPGPAGMELGQAFKGGPSIITSVVEGTQASSMQIPLGSVITKVNNETVSEHTATLKLIKTVKDHLGDSDTYHITFRVAKEEQTFEFMPGPAGMELGQAFKGGPSIITSVVEGTQASSMQIPLGSVITKVNNETVSEHTATLKLIKTVKDNLGDSDTYHITFRVTDPDLVVKTGHVMPRERSNLKAESSNHIALKGAPSNCASTSARLRGRGINIRGRSGGLLSPLLAPMRNKSHSKKRGGLKFKDHDRSPAVLYPASTSNLEMVEDVRRISRWEQKARKGQERLAGKTAFSRLVAQESAENVTNSAMEKGEKASEMNMDAGDTTRDLSRTALLEITLRSPATISMTYENEEASTLFFPRYLAFVHPSNSITCAEISTQTSILFKIHITSQSNRPLKCRK
jgi:S1-C subfamily serine protease